MTWQALWRARLFGVPGSLACQALFTNISKNREGNADVHWGLTPDGVYPRLAVVTSRFSRRAR